MQATQLPATELAFREGNSDKVYRTAIEGSNGRYVVNFAYGRRGATLNTGTKTTSPVPYDEAIDIYEKLVKSKTAKGYKPVGQTGTGKGIGMTLADTDQRDTGLRAQLLNPITEEEAVLYLANPAWCAQEKFDGKRMLLRKGGNAITAANRHGLSIGFPAIVEAQLAERPQNFVIDGECVGEKFYAFDLLELDGKDLRGDAYLERLTPCTNCFPLPGCIIPAETVLGAEKTGFLAKLKASGKESVVFKNLAAPWTVGRPNTGGNATKCKFWASCSCVVMEINAKRSIALRLGDVHIGNVTIPPNQAIPKVGQVVEVKYLYVRGTPTNTLTWGYYPHSH